VKHKIYYGWWIVVASFFTLFVCAGIGFFSFPVFLKFIEADMGWSMTSLSIAAALSALAAGFSTPFIGWTLDRFGPRAIMIPGACVLSASFLLLSRITSIHQLYVLFLAVGIGMAATTVLPCQTLVSRWFDRRRGRAMGMAMVANGLGATVWVFVTNQLIEHYAWRDAYEILGVIIAAVSLPLIYFIIRGSPQSMGLTLEGRPDPRGEEETSVLDTGAVTAEEPGYAVRRAFGTPSFWLIVVSTFCLVFASSGFGLHVVAFLRVSGLTPGRAAAVWSITAAVSTVSRFLFGFISERYQKRYLASGANVARAIAVFLLLLFVLGFVPELAAVGQLVLLYGLGVGCNAVVNPLVVSETFGVKAFGKLMGLIGIPYTIGMALGMFAGGYLFDLHKDYNIAFAAFALAFLVAGIAISLARPYFLFERVSDSGADGKPEKM